MYGLNITVEKASAWEFRQMAAELDVGAPEGEETSSLKNDSQ